MSGLAEFLSLGKSVGGCLGLCVCLGLCLLELHLRLFKLLLGFIELFERAGVGIFDLVHVGHLGEELIEGLGVQDETHERIGRLFILVHIAHDLAGFALLLGELGLELGDQRIVLINLGLELRDILCCLVIGGGGILKLFLGLGKLRLSLLGNGQSGCRAQGGARKRERQCSADNESLVSMSIIAHVRILR